MSETHQKKVSECTAAELYEYATLVMQDSVHQICTEKGFWMEGPFRNKYEMIALMHSELSEAVEKMRKCKKIGGHDEGPIDVHDVKDDKLPEEGAVGVELADTVIRILDFCQGNGISLGDLVAKKVAYNAGRPHMHGKNA